MKAMDFRSFWKDLPPNANHFQAVSVPAESVRFNLNPITNWLDTAGIPWRQKRNELADTFGVSADNPYQWDLVSLDVRPPPLMGMLWPLNFQVQKEYSPHVPPIRLSTHIYIAEDPEANIQFAARQLRRHLGANNIMTRHGVRQVTWKYGEASVELTAWPLDRSANRQQIFGSNVAHERDPRLETACSVTIWTGWRPHLTAQERNFLEGFTPIYTNASWLASPAESARTDLFHYEHEIEFIRERPSWMTVHRGSVGLSADKMVLIYCYYALYVIPTIQIASFEVVRILPAKGPGGSALVVHCHTGYEANQVRKITIAHGTKADDLNHAATELATILQKPLSIGDYQMDI